MVTFRSTRLTNSCRSAETPRAVCSLLVFEAGGAVSVCERHVTLGRRASGVVFALVACGPVAHSRQISISLTQSTPDVGASSWLARFVPGVHARCILRCAPNP